MREHSGTLATPRPASRLERRVPAPMTRATRSCGTSRSRSRSGLPLDVPFPREEPTLSTVYLLALCAVGVALIAALLDAVLAASRRREWQVERPTLMLVTAEDRRTRALPFVGSERRAPDGGTPSRTDERQIA